MEFDWDPAKEYTNKEKHRVSFEDAKAIWDLGHLEVKDIAYAESGEKRSATIGWIRNRLYVAIWTKRHSKIRLISVRRARENEEKVFFEKIQK